MSVTAVVMVDATFGAGGYTQAILATPGARVVAIDRDHNAVAAGAALVEAMAGRLDLIEGRFSNLETLVKRRGVDAVDGIVFDVGVSSMQLDGADRGFSFRFDGSLDMRMGQDGPSAADIIFARASGTGIWPLSSPSWGKAGTHAPLRAPLSVRAEQAISHDGGIGRSGRARCAHQAGRHPPGHAHVPGARIFVNDELAELAHGFAGRRAVAETGRQGAVWLSCRFIRFEDRIVKTLLDRTKPCAGFVAPRSTFLGTPPPLSFPCPDAPP